jgi:hypothetical protein
MQPVPVSGITCWPQLNQYQYKYQASLVAAIKSVPVPISGITSLPHCNHCQYQASLVIRNATSTDTSTRLYLLAAIQPVPVSGITFGRN